VQQVEDLKSLLAVRERADAFADAIEEVLALGLERFLLLDVGDVHVAVMIGVIEFAERVVMRRAFNARVVDFDLFNLRDVVVNDHALAADDRDLARLARIEPAAVNHRRAIVPEIDAHAGHVFDSGRDVRAATSARRRRVARELEQMVALVERQPQGAGDRAHHRLRRPRPSPLLQPRVEVGRHVRHRGHVLTPQPVRPAPRPGAQADVLGLERRAALAQEVGESVAVHCRS